MLQTKGTKRLPRTDCYNGCIWTWDTKTLEGTTIAREMWERVPIDRVYRAARNSLCYRLLAGAAASGRLADREVQAFAVDINDEGVFISYTLTGYAMDFLKIPIQFNPHYFVYMDMAWVGILFSPDLQALKDILRAEPPSDALLMEYGFQKTHWNESSATYSCKMYYIKVNEGRVEKMNF